MGEEDFGAYLVWRTELEQASDFMKRLVQHGYEPILVSPPELEMPSDDEMVVLEPESDERAVRTEGLVPLLRHLVNHLRSGERRAVVIFDLRTLQEGNGFHELTAFIGRLYEEACVNRGLVLMFAERTGFTNQELAFLERETAVLKGPDDIFPPFSETVK